MPKCVTCNGAGVVDYLFEGKPLGWKCPACEGTGNAQDVTVPRGYDCCDPTSPSHDPVVVRLQAEVAELSGKSGELERERDALQAAVEQLKSTPEHYLRGCVNVLASKLAEYTGKTVPTEITGAESVVDENEELRAEVERLDTAWRAIDRANESLREQLGTLRGLLREAAIKWEFGVDTCGMRQVRLPKEWYARTLKTGVLPAPAAKGVGRE